MTRLIVNRWWWLSSCLFAALGCGGGAAPQPAARSAAPSGGQETPVAQAPESEQEPQSLERPEAKGPARITVEAKVHGKAAPANVLLLGPDGGEVAHAASGQALSVQSGEYELQVQITAASALLDKPTQQRPLTLHAGDDLHESVEFPWAMVQLNVMVNGSADPNATIRLSRGGSDVGVLKSGAAPAPISPGRYDAEATTHGAKIKVDGLLFPEGATQSVPVNVRL